MDLPSPVTRAVHHAETPYRRAVVVSDFLLLGVEAYALSDNGGWCAVVAPYAEGPLEAHSEDPLGDF